MPSSEQFLASDLSGSLTQSSLSRDLMLTICRWDLDQETMKKEASDMAITILISPQLERGA